MVIAWSCEILLVLRNDSDCGLPFVAQVAIAANKKSTSSPRSSMSCSACVLSVIDLKLSLLGGETQQPVHKYPVVKVLRSPPEEQRERVL